MKQLTKEQAIAIYQSGEWKDWTDGEIVRFQLFQDRVALPFERFHQAIEVVLERGVFTHEFASSNIENLRAEYLGQRQAPTFEEIIAMVPPEKLIIIGDES